MRTSLFVFALACSALTMVSASAPGKEPSGELETEFFPQPKEREARLEAALDQPLSINFADTPLVDVATWFGSKLEVPVILHHRSLEDAGISSDTPVTRRVDGITARAALKLVLDELDLASLQKDGVLVIVTKDQEETELFTRVYPVGDLTPLEPALVPSGRVVGMTGAGHAKAGEGPSAKPSAELAPPTVNEPAKPPRMVPDFDSLIRVITTTVKPQTWAEVGGAGSISEMVVAKSIVVSQTREVHEEILELLRALRAAKQAGGPNPATN